MKPLALFFTLFGLVVFASAQKQNDQGRLLIFEAEVLEIGTAPTVVCGVTSPYRIAKYKILKVLQGSFKKKEIIVHHLFCNQGVLEDIRKKDKVVVVIDLKKPPAQVSPDGEILKDSSKGQTHYSAVRVAHLTSCCDF